MSKRLVMIPALNEEQTIGDVVREAQAAIQGARVLVINDGSTDRTAEVARAAGALVIDLPLRTGIGCAVQVGYIYALRNGYELVVRLDGDGQHPADQAAALIAKVESGAADVAVGSRFVISVSRESTTATRVLGIRLFSVLMRVMFSLRSTDPTSGLWVVGPAALKLLSSHSPDDFPEVESLAVCQRMGLRVCELPVRMRSRQGGRSSIGYLDALLYMAKVVFSLVVISIRRYDSRGLPKDPLELP
ncbi:MAG: glycosyltransferase family 2 protein [Candidatus Alcyoniella australis]|nr:glycosyltransferase family 2 protein [Candidatus Alcyoniella australis]